MKHTLTANIMLLLLAQGVYADIVVIGPNTLNGSFESGEISPWGDGSVVSNGGFAAEGNWYAQTKPDMWRAGIWQFFPAVSTSMPVFTLSFRLRDGTPAYTAAVGCALSGRRQDNTWLSSSQVQLSAPPPNGDEWVEHRYVFTFNEPWDESRSMQLTIDWNDGATNSIGYLDDVRLTQISDPTCIQDLSISDGSLTLTIQHLAASNTFSIQRCFDLTNDTWDSVSNLMLTIPGVQWSEDVSNQWDKVFYRLKKE